LLDEVPGDGFTGSAADVEHGATRRHETTESIEPCRLEQAIASIVRPGASVPLIQFDDALCVGGHGHHPDAQAAHEQ
jgi:hypothetical protein